MKNRIIKRHRFAGNFPQKMKLLGGILLGIVALYYFSFNDYGIIRHFHTKKELQQIKTKITLLEKQQEEINTTIEKLKNDYDYIEKQAREQLGLAKPGEEIYIVKESELGTEVKKR